MTKKFRKSYFGYMVLVISWTIPLIFFFSIDRSTIKGNLGLFNCMGTAVLWFLMFLPGLLTTWSILSQFSIEYGDIGISRRFPTNGVILNWREIEDVESTIFSLILRTRKKSVRINLLIYKNSKEVIDFITTNITNARMKQ